MGPGDLERNSRPLTNVGQSCPSRSPYCGGIRTSVLVQYLTHDNQRLHLMQELFFPQDLFSSKILPFHQGHFLTFYMFKNAGSHQMALESQSSCPFLWRRGLRAPEPEPLDFSRTFLCSFYSQATGIADASECLGCRLVFYYLRKQIKSGQWLTTEIQPRVRF